jgi:formylglycine-generating enzyme required for sulfatase activity
MKDSDCKGADKFCFKQQCADTVKWVYIQGGKFNMGSTGYTNEKPVHEVNVGDFNITKTEVTVSQYGECVTKGVCTEPGIGKTHDNWDVAGRENHPVNDVYWNQADIFCKWKGGRLPSEAEWEYAASNGGKNKYPWGEETSTCEYGVMAIMGEEADGCGEDSTWPVCSKTAGNTSHGLCDMAGNVAEWVQDWYHDDYNGAPTDGSAWENPIGSNRVIRGGSLISFAGKGDLRATSRFYHSMPSNWGYSVGFRCAK